MPLIQFHRDDGKVVSNDTPTDPTFQTGQAMIETTVQPPRAAQVTDAAFDAVAEAAGGAEPRVVLMSLPGFRLVAGLGQAHAPHAQFPGLAFIRGRIDPAIAAHFTRSFAELTPMGFQTGLQLIGIRRIAGQNAILADQAAIDFGVPEVDGGLISEYS